MKMPRSALSFSSSLSSFVGSSPPVEHQDSLVLVFAVVVVIVIVEDRLMDIFFLLSSSLIINVKRHASGRANAGVRAVCKIVCRRNMPQMQTVRTRSRVHYTVHDDTLESNAPRRNA